MSSQSTRETDLAYGAGSWLALGLLFLLVSFFLMLGVANVHGGGNGLAVLSWCENAAFWLGIVFVGGDVIARVVRRPVSDRGGQP